MSSTMGVHLTQKREQVRDNRVHRPFTKPLPWELVHTESPLKSLSFYYMAEIQMLGEMTRVTGDGDSLWLQSSRPSGMSLHLPLGSGFPALLLPLRLQSLLLPPELSTLPSSLQQFWSTLDSSGLTDIPFHFLYYQFPVLVPHHTQTPAPKHTSYSLVF